MTDKTKMKLTTNHYLYEQLADNLTRAIHNGVYSLDERLPSLRYLSAQYQVSIATVIQAYQQLEVDGLICSRPKSGYFVSPWISNQLDEPFTSQPKTIQTNVSVGHIAMSLINESRQPGLIKLGAAVPEPDLLPLASLSRTASGVARRKHLALGSYEYSQGNIDLRKQIVHLMRDSGVHCFADDIIITNGCLESLSLALRVVAKNGDTIVIESPTHFGILQIIESLGLKALEIPTHASTGIDLNALNYAISKENIAACILMPTFSNPLGSTMPEENIRQVVKLLDMHQIPLIEDDVNGSLSYNSLRPQAAKAYDSTGNVIYCSSFSKTISPGIRIGWILAGQYKEQTLYQKFLENISTSIHSQQTLAEFLSKGGYRRCVRRSSRIYHKRMDLLRRWVSDAFPPETRLSNPKGGFLLWVQLPQKTDALDLYHKAMSIKVAITPGILFSAQDLYKSHIRLSCGAIEGEKAQKAIYKLAELL